MGATVLSQDKKEEQSIYVIEDPLYGPSIYLFVTQSHTDTSTDTNAATAAANRFATLFLLNADDARVDGLLVAWFTEKGPSNECMFTSCRTLSDREVNN